jgi:hypothetical protein
MSFQRQRFEHRHYRGFTSPPQIDTDNQWGRSPCWSCGTDHLARVEVEEPLCFDCTHQANPFAGKQIHMSVDATGEDSTNPSRVADGTQGFNMGLPPVTERTGQVDAYGQHKVKSRPRANNEFASARRLREAAKRNNLTPGETQKRALPK